MRDLVETEFDPEDQDITGPFLISAYEIVKKKWGSTVAGEAIFHRGPWRQ